MKKNIHFKQVTLDIRKRIKEHITLTPERAKAFFKTDPGAYGEKDIFIGVTVPSLRKIAKEFHDLSIQALECLISSKINEERLLGLLILTQQYATALDENKKSYYDFYLRMLPYVNNWNLVDASAHLILGNYLWDKDRKALLSLAKSDILWERRIAIVATWYFIKKDDLVWTFRISRMLLKDSHDLIHKAVGWMLREAGKRDTAELIKFLTYYADKMPRTMLRYAIEKFPEKQRKHYLRRS